MNKDQFAGKWHELKGKIKQKWGKLTDQDLMQINGKWEACVGIMQKHYGLAKEQAEQELNSFCDECMKQQPMHGEKKNKWEDKKRKAS